MPNNIIKHSYSGVSLLELKEKFGTGPSGFYDNPWWLNQAFAKEYAPKGVYEIDFGNLQVNKTFEEQKAVMQKGFEVTHPAVLAEAILTHYAKTKKRLLENIWCRTSLVDSDGYRVYVGYFVAGGLSVYGYWDDFRYDGLALSAARKSKKNLAPRTLDSFDPSDLESRISALEKTVTKLTNVININGK